jgi:CRP-like cAMP-binding protein
MSDGDPLFARFGQSCPAGTVLFKENEQGNTMYVLQSGRVRISKASQDASKTLAILGPGEFFGEMAILNAKPRTATAETLVDSKLLVIDARTFEQMVVSNTEIALRLIKKLARRLDSANELIEILMQKDPKARVILGLSRESEVIGQTRDDGSVLIPISLADLAQQVGLGNEEVEHVIHRLARLQMVEHHADGFVVTDTARLHEFLEFLEMQSKFGDGAPT